MIYFVKNEIDPKESENSTFLLKPQTTRAYLMAENGAQPDRTNQDGNPLTCNDSGSSDCASITIILIHWFNMIA